MKYVAIDAAEELNLLRYEVFVCEIQWISLNLLKSVKPIEARMKIFQDGDTQ